MNTRIKRTNRSTSFTPRKPKRGVKRKNIASAGSKLRVYTVIGPHVHCYYKSGRDQYDIRKLKCNTRLQTKEKQGTEKEQYQLIHHHNNVILLRKLNKFDTWEYIHYNLNHHLILIILIIMKILNRKKNQ